MSQDDHQLEKVGRGVIYLSTQKEEDHKQHNLCKSGPYRPNRNNHMTMMVVPRRYEHMKIPGDQ